MLYYIIALHADFYELRQKWIKDVQSIWMNKASVQNTTRPHVHVKWGHMYIINDLSDIVKNVITLIIHLDFWYGNFINHLWAESI